MRVEQVMTRIVFTCGPDDRLERAAQLMWEHDCGVVPIVDADNRVVGMITDRDVAMAAYTQGKLLSQVSVRCAMSEDVHSCGHAEDINTVLERMRRYQLRRLPVTDATGNLVGLISMNDIALEAARAQGARKPPVSLNGVALALAAVSHHRGADQLVAAQ